MPGISVPFVANDGRYDQRVRFSASTFAGTLLVMDDGHLEYQLQRPEGPCAGLDGTHSKPVASTFAETFVGGHATPLAGTAHPTQLSRFVGPLVGHGIAQPSRPVRTYEDVSLGEVFAGVDVRLRATGRNVEKIFTVAPHADPQRIHMRLREAQSLALAGDGRLLARLEGGDVAFTAPVAFQEIAGERVPVAVTYTIDAASREYGFAVGAYDRNEPLVIDPLLQSTYLGGGSDDAITAMAVHPANGEVIVAGLTNSADLTCPIGGCMGAQPHRVSGLDGFVARFDPTLTQLRQLTYFGGSGQDQINAVAVDPATGDIIVAGNTTSTDLPCTATTRGCANGGQSDLGGGGDGFVARFDSTLTVLRQASYIGGTGVDQVNAVAVHPLTGDVLVAGSTDSLDLPCTSLASGCGATSQPQIAGVEDGFVARFSPALTTLIHATYFGGTSVDRILALAVHPQTGEIVVAGQSQSHDLPCTHRSLTCADAAQQESGGGEDGFVARFSGNLTRLLQATYVGTPSAESIFALAVHPLSGEIYVGGFTASASFPCVTVGDGCASGAQTTNLSGETGFVLRLDANLTRRLQATYAGGTSFDAVMALAIHPLTGEVFVAGQTNSSDLPCTLAGNGCGKGAQSQSGGGLDGFVTRLDAALTRRLQSTYYGGSGIDAVAALAAHPQTGEIYIAGNTTSTDLPCTSQANGCEAGVQPGLIGGSLDAFVARFSADLSFNDATPDPLLFAVRSGVPVATLTTSSPALVTGLAGPVPVYVEGALGSAYCISSAANCGCNVSGSFTTAPGNVDSGQFVCVRHVSAPIADGIARTVFHAGGGAGVFRSVTGNFAPSPVAVGCSLDIDGNNAVDALTDGMLLLRAMMGFTGTAVTGGAVGHGATRSDWAAIRAYLNGNCGLGVQP